MTRAALFSLMLVLSRAHAGPPVTPLCDPGVEAVRDVRAVAAGIIAADNARDIDRVLGYYSADAVLMPPGEEPVQGREAIRPRYEALFSGFDPEIRGRVDESCVGEGLAFVRGHNGGRLVSRQGGEDRLLDDAYLMVLRRDTDGRWRISRLMWHRASALPPKEPEG